MIQSFFLLRDHAPNTSHKNGLNKSVCGNCPHAGYNNNSCYVKWFQAITSLEVIQKIIDTIILNEVVQNLLKIEVCV